MSHAQCQVNLRTHHGADERNILQLNLFEHLHGPGLSECGQSEISSNSKFSAQFPHQRIQPQKEKKQTPDVANFVFHFSSLKVEKGSPQTRIPKCTRQCDADPAHIHNPCLVQHRNWAQLKPAVRPILYHEGPEEDWLTKIKKAGQNGSL